VKQVYPVAYNGGEARVCVIGANRVEEMRLKKEMKEVLWAQKKEIGEIKSNLAALSTQKPLGTPVSLPSEEGAHK
jgi:hypothetical protein